MFLAKRSGSSAISLRIT
jgi:hypothetical protein